MYIGYDDYVVAANALSAAALWTDHFDADGADPKDFDPIPDDEVIALWFEGDYVIASAEAIEAGRAWVKCLSARAVIDLLGDPGYLASTTEDD